MRHVSRAAHSFVCLFSLRRLFVGAAFQDAGRVGDGGARGARGARRGRRLPDHAVPLLDRPLRQFERVLRRTQRLRRQLGRAAFVHP